MSAMPQPATLSLAVVRKSKEHALHSVTARAHALHTQMQRNVNVL